MKIVNVIGNDRMYSIQDCIRNHLDDTHICQDEPEKYMCQLERILPNASTDILKISLMRNPSKFGTLTQYENLEFIDEESAKHVLSQACLLGNLGNFWQILVEKINAHKILSQTPENSMFITRQCNKSLDDRADNLFEFISLVANEEIELTGFSDDKDLLMKELHNTNLDNGEKLKMY